MEDTDTANTMKMKLFSEEEVRDIYGLIWGCGGGGSDGDDYIEVSCGCTSHRYGDAAGRLRVFSSGFLEISCECFPGCKEGLSLQSILHPSLELLDMYSYVQHRSLYLDPVWDMGFC